MDFCYDGEGLMGIMENGSSLMCLLMKGVVDGELIFMDIDVGLNVDVVELMVVVGVEEK